MRTTTALASIGFLLSATAVVAEKPSCGNLDECVQVCENCIGNSSFFCATDSKCYSSSGCHGSPCENETSLCVSKADDCRSVLKKLFALALGFILLIVCSVLCSVGLCVALCCCCYRRQRHNEYSAVGTS